MHLVSLQQAAGVESHFTEFVIQARAGLTDKLAVLFSSNLVADAPKEALDADADERKALIGLVGREGIEPSTNGLRVRCSTN